MKKLQNVAGILLLVLVMLGGSFLVHLWAQAILPSWLSKDRDHGTWL